MANIDVSNIKVLQSVYDYKVRTKKLKIYSFALFHKCQYRCVEKIKSVLDPENCFQECEKELDEYFDFKKSKVLDKAVFYAIPEYKEGNNQQYIIPKEEILDQQYILRLLAKINAYFMSKSLNRNKMISQIS
ncbi:hypothetical protein pb186bvf_006079 [Paramecium bursaria]